MKFGIFLGLIAALIVIQPVAVTHPPIHLMSTALIFIAATIVALFV